GWTRGGGAVGFLLGWYRIFPSSALLRSRGRPVSSACHIARSVRISRTTRSCTLHLKGYGTIRLERLQRPTDDTTRGTPKRVPAYRTAIPCSTASSRNLDVGTPEPDVAESSFLPSLGCRRNTGYPDFRKSYTMTRAKWVSRVLLAGFLLD